MCASKVEAVVTLGSSHPIKSGVELKSEYINLRFRLNLHFC